MEDRNRPGPDLMTLEDWEGTGGDSRINAVLREEAPSSQSTDHPAVLRVSFVVRDLCERLVLEYVLLRFTRTLYWRVFGARCYCDLQLEVH